MLCGLSSSAFPDSESYYDHTGHPLGIYIQMALDIRDRWGLQLTDLYSRTFGNWWPKTHITDSADTFFPRASHEEMELPDVSLDQINQVLISPSGAEEDKIPTELGEERLWRWNETEKPCPEHTACRSMQIKYINRNANLQVIMLSSCHIWLSPSWRPLGLWGTSRQPSSASRGRFSSFL